MFYVRAQSPSIITFITLDPRTNTKALLKEINKRISEEETALQIIFMSVPRKLNQASVRQPGLSVCCPPGSIPARGRGAPGKPPPLVPGAANPLSGCQTPAAEACPQPENPHFYTHKPGGRQAASSTFVSAEPGGGRARSAAGVERRKDQARAVCRTAGKARAAFPWGCTAPGPLCHVLAPRALTGWPKELCKAGERSPKAELIPQQCPSHAARLHEARSAQRAPVPASAGFIFPSRRDAPGTELGPSRLPWSCLRDCRGGTTRLGLWKLLPARLPW